MNEKVWPAYITQHLEYIRQMTLQPQSRESKKVLNTIQKTLPKIITLSIIDHTYNE